MTVRRWRRDLAPLREQHCWTLENHRPLFHRNPHFKEIASAVLKIVRRLALTLLARREEKSAASDLSIGASLQIPILCGTGICATHGLSLGALMSGGLSCSVKPARVHGGLYCDPAIFDLELERILGIPCPLVIPSDDEVAHPAFADRTVHHVGDLVAAVVTESRVQVTPEPDVFAGPAVCV